MFKSKRQTFYKIHSYILLQHFEDKRSASEKFITY